MSMLLMLELVRVFTCLVFLLIASLYDVKSREVPDTVWIIFAPVSSVLTLLSIVLSGRNIWAFLIWTIVIAIMSAFSIALFYLGLFGGADAKALICLAAAMPFQPNLPFTKFFDKYAIQFFIPPPISTLNNSVLFAALLTIPFLIKNLIDYIKSKRIFEGLEHERSFKKVLALLTGYRVDVSKLRLGGHYYLPMEEFVKHEDGSLSRKLRVFSRLPADEEWPKEVVPRDFRGKIWVTPGLPFMVFITIGFLTTIFIGDIILLSVSIVFIH